MADLFDNPMGLRASSSSSSPRPTPDTLEPVFEKLGFTLVAQAPLEGRACCIARATSTSSSTASRRAPPATSPPSTGRRPAAWRFACKDSHKAYERALELGAQPVEMPTGPMELRLPAIKGIGGAPLYLIDRFEDGKSIYDIDFEFIEGVDRHPAGHGLKLIDHLTHNVYRGRMAFWAELLRAALQLPRDPLLRHPGRVHRPDLEGDDRARRQDPHPAERGIVEGLGPDRGVPDEVQRRGHPAHRAAQRRPARDHRQARAWPACR